MGYRLLAATCLLFLVALSDRSFVDTLPVDSSNGGNSKQKDETVEELESLKHLLEQSPPSGKQISVSKSQTSVFSDVNGHRSGHKETKEEVNKNGKLVAKVSQKLDVSQEKTNKPKAVSETEVEIPSKGIHKTILKDGENLEALGSPEVIEGQDFTNSGERRNNARTSDNGIDKLNSYSGIEYSPLDMAEYVFWTGDEKSVTLAIEEFLDEGLMTREEAINFLQSIKFNLDYMQTHYQGLQKIEDKIASKLQERANLQQKLLTQEKYLQKQMGIDYDLPGDNAKQRDMYDDSKTLYDIAKAKAELYDRPLPMTKDSKFKFDPYEPKQRNPEEDYLSEKKRRYRDDVKSPRKLLNGISVSDEDYEELLERLRVADFLYTEYSLEEVIYQLAKVMFSQSLTRGSKEAQKALERFTTFLEKEAEHGQISRSLEKKILDVLLAALADMLSEHPELVPAARESLSNIGEANSSSSGMLKQLLQNSDEGRTPDAVHNAGKSSGKPIPSSHEKLSIQKKSE